MMLAQRGAVDDIADLQERGYLFDLKIDGVRCQAEVDSGEVRLYSRQGTPMEHRYPEVVEALLVACPEGRLVLDGEIAVDGPDGLPSWPLSHKRDAQQSAIRVWVERLPAVFYAFDVLEGSEDIRSWPYERRRQQLEWLAMRWPREHLRPVLHSADGLALWDVVTTHRLEGMVAKKSQSPYRDHKRTREWVKVKRTSTVTCLVGGTDPGEGSRAATFGALHLYLLDSDHQLVQVGKVGSGFSARELVDIVDLLEKRVPLIVEVEHLDVSPDGQLRQPVFQRVRTDVGMLDCMLDQLETES